jgi:hypothetical protein
MTTEMLINLIAELAKEIDKEDPIDFGMLKVDDDTLWNMMASHAVELVKFQSESDKFIYLATVTKLLVENFVFHAQMMKIMENR